MAFVKNTTKQEIRLTYGGREYIFPADAWVEIDSHDVAKWFESKAYLAPSPRDGRPDHEQRLMVHHTMGEDASGAPKKPVQVFLFEPQPAPPPRPPPVEKPRTYAPLIRDPAAVAEDRRRAIAAANPEEMIREAVKRGIMKGLKDRSKDLALVFEELVKSGYIPPRR